MRLTHLSVSSDLLQILLQYAENIGLEKTTVEKQAHLDLSKYQFSTARIPAHSFHGIWNTVRDLSADPDFGLHFGEYSHKLFRRSLLYAMMMNCENVEQAIGKNFLYHNLITDIVKPIIKIQNTHAVLTWGLAHPGLKEERHLSESVLATLISMLQYLTDDRIRLKEVRFTHSQPPNVENHQRLFQSPLIFSAKANEIILSKEMLTVSILLANGVILEGLERLVQQALHQSYDVNTWSEQVARTLYNALIREKATDITTITRKLGLSERSLQMKLKEENTTFRQLLNEVRKEIAVNYLTDPQAAVSEIALLLGFADQSAFQHAFKRWVGKTPGKFRSERIQK